MVNTILIPVISSYYLKDQNFYYVNGLVDNIFMLSISISIVPPIVLLINPLNLFTKIIRCIKSRPGTFTFIQEANSIRIKKSTIFFMREFNSRLAIKLFILLVISCSSASLSLFNQLYQSQYWLGICSCTGLKNILFLIDIKDLFLEWISLIMLRLR